jgi:hypothetical protein
MKSVRAAAALFTVALMLPAFAQTQTIRGHLVDVMCATEHAKEGAAYGAKHDKKCLLMDGCVKSGYSVLTAEGRVVKLDAKGSAMALELIKKTSREADWRVTVAGNVSGDIITVSTLTLQ